jgi:hypothetical protein
MRRISFRACPYCGSSEVYRSRRKSWSDLAALLFFLGIARCHGCMRRHFRPLFSPAPDHVVLVSEDATAPIRADEDDNVKRSA